MLINEDLVRTHERADKLFKELDKLVNQDNFGIDINQGKNKSIYFFREAFPDYFSQSGKFDVDDRENAKNFTTLLIQALSVNDVVVSRTNWDFRDFASTSKNAIGYYRNLSYQDLINEKYQNVLIFKMPRDIIEEYGRFDSDIKKFLYVKWYKNRIISIHDISNITDFVDESCLIDVLLNESKQSENKIKESYNLGNAYGTYNKYIDEITEALTNGPVKITTNKDRADISYNNGFAHIKCNVGSIFPILYELCDDKYDIKIEGVSINELNIEEISLLINNIGTGKTTITIELAKSKYNIDVTDLPF